MANDVKLDNRSGTWLNPQAQQWGEGLQHQDYFNACNFNQAIIQFNRYGDNFTIINNQK